MDFALGKINIITGKKNVGKSKLCINLISEFRKNNYSVAGIVSPGKYIDNKKTSIFAQNISNGKMIELAQYTPGWDLEKPQRIWKINNIALPWGNSVLKNIQPCDVLVIDEIGFLEFEKRSGWTQVFQVLEEDNYKIAFIVVRPELIENALTHWENARVINLIDEDDRDKILSSIFVQIKAIFAR